MHKSRDLVRLFDELFAKTNNTQLVAGGKEPVYLPASVPDEYHRIIFAHDFFASALHEVAHWCIAGKARRKLTDYGYWYEPEGRTPDKQAAFARVEAKPQALEWVFHRSAGHPFSISLDNPGVDLTEFTPFKRAIVEEIDRFKQQGLPARALLFQRALADFYGQIRCFRQYDYSLDHL